MSRTILIRDVGARMFWPCLGYEWTQITSLDLPTLGSHELRVWGAPGLTEWSRNQPPLSLPHHHPPDRCSRGSTLAWPIPGRVGLGSVTRVGGLHLQLTAARKPGKPGQPLLNAEDTPAPSDESVMNASGLSAWNTRQDTRRSHVCCLNTGRHGRFRLRLPVGSHFLLLNP